MRMREAGESVYLGHFNEAAVAGLVEGAPVQDVRGLRVGSASAFRTDTTRAHVSTTAHERFAGVGRSG